MPIFRNKRQQDYRKTWQNVLNSIELSVQKLECDMEEASKTTRGYYDKWCEPTEDIIDELNIALITLGEPNWDDLDDSNKIEQLKCRIDNLYIDYCHTYYRVGSA